MILTLSIVSYTNSYEQFRTEQIPFIDDLSDEDTRLFEEMLDRMATEKPYIPQYLEDVFISEIYT